MASGFDAVPAPPEPGRILPRALGVGALAGGATGALLALWTGALNGWAASLDTLLLALYFGTLYAVLTSVLLVAVAFVALLLGRRPSRRTHWATVGAAVVLYGGAQRYHSSVQFLTPTAHLSAVGLIDLLALGVCAALAAGAVLARSRRRRAAYLAAAAALLVGIDRLNVRHERPLERDLAREVPRALGAAPTPARSPAGSALERTRLVVLGFDGLSWEMLLPLLADGSLPGFHDLLEGAAYGYLGSFPEVALPPSRYRRLTHPESISPTVWETLSTGMAPDRHGIGYHNYFVFPGIERKVRHLPTHYRGNSPLGLRSLLAASRRVAPWDLVPFDARDALVARFYEVAEREGLAVGSVNWRNTGPVAPVHGFVYGFGLSEPRSYPADLEQGLPPLPATRPLEPEAPEQVAMRATFERALLERFFVLAERHPTEVLLYYTHFHDGANHHHWRLETAGRSFFVAGLSHPRLVPGPASRSTMEILDQTVRGVLARVSAETVVVVVSDHGFDWREYKHHNGPPGVLIVRAAGIRPGPFAGASVFDVAPSLLHWLGLPVADDLVGRPLALAVPGGPLDRPVARVASWGPARRVEAAAEADPEALREQEEYLRSLGYVN